jgi:NAD(P)-dependent dehydrogenase (short-subunit alcohol dehydrogenase family)
MTLVNKVVLVTGASRGIGAATVRAFLNHGVTKVYAGARNPAALPDFGDKRVVPLQLDITSQADVDAAVALAGDVDIVVNNAGTAGFASVLNSSLEAVGADFETNFYGTLRVLQAFGPVLAKKGSGVIANVISIVGLAAAPALGGYSASKAALHSVTQSARTELRASGVNVLGIYPGPIDTELARDLPLAKAPPETAAERIVAGIEASETYIFTDPTADQIGHLWRTNAPALEAALAGVE